MSYILKIYLLVDREKKEGRGKFEYLENKKIYLGEIKSVSHSF